MDLERKRNYRMYPLIFWVGGNQRNGNIYGWERNLKEKDKDDEMTFNGV